MTPEERRELVALLRNAALALEGNDNSESFGAAMPTVKASRKRPSPAGPVTPITDLERAAARAALLALGMTARKP